MNRRARLRELIRKRGGVVALAKALGYANASFLVQMAGPSPTRAVSERTARLIERKAGLPDGWLDQDIGKSARMPISVLRDVTGASERLGLALPQTKLADIVDFVCAHSTAPNRQKFIGDLLPLVADA
jgi:hypothetical protein